jgi:hypothetical protein
MEFNTEFLQFSSLEASIYRQRVQMSIWLDKTGRRLDGSHRSSGRTICNQLSKNFAENLSCFEPRPNGCTSATSNFHIEASRIRTKGMVIQAVDLMLVCSDHVDWRSNVWILNAILALWMSASGQESTSSGRLQKSSHICVLERNPEAWSNTECRPDVLLKRPDGCKLKQFEVLDTEEGPEEKFSSSGRMML